jgi:superfamily II DNA or RNA helicase
VSAETLLGPVAGSIILRPYQLEAINAIFKKWLEYDRLLTVWPTGAGKTIGFAHVALSRIARGPVLILAHRDEFREGQTQILVNSMLLTEGYDEPSIDCIVPLRPTKIRSLYAQQVGRGTRTDPGKKDLLLLDFLWHSRRHNLAQPASLIAHDDAETQRIRCALAKGSGDLLEAHSDAARQREEALAAELEENRRREGETVDLLELAKQFRTPAFVDYQPFLRWHRLAITENQLRILTTNKIDPSLVRDRGHAAVIIDGICIFEEREPATEKQLRYMRYLGHPDPFGVAMTKRAAGRWIQARKAELMEFQAR